MHRHSHTLYPYALIPIWLVDFRVFGLVRLCVPFLHFQDEQSDEPDMSDSDKDAGVIVSPLATGGFARVQQWQYTWKWERSNCFILSALDNVFIMLRYQPDLFRNMDDRLERRPYGGWAKRAWTAMCRCLFERALAVDPITTDAVAIFRDIMTSQ